MGIWTAIGAGVVLSIENFGHLLGLAVGTALGAEPASDAQVEVWWLFVALAVGLAATAVAAPVVRRWVAFALALILCAGCAFFALGLFANVRPVVLPAAPFHHVEPGGPRCACYSDSPCDCPGG